jgi:3-oxosteroid 1-dehydrogenase
VTGDHFALVEPLGAQLASVERVPGLGYREPGNADGPDRWYPFYSGWPHAMSVNQRGERFTDESGGHTRDFGKTMRESKDELASHMGGDYWAVFDSQYAEKYSVGVHPPGGALPEHFVNAGSLGELAARTGIDPAGLSATVARLNQAAADGHDPDFGRGENPWSFAQFADPIHRPNPSLGRIDKPPFYAVKLEHVGLGMTRTGLRVDDRARVLGQDGPIPGLYAAGNSMAWIDIGANVHPGTSNARGMTWGYVAARHAAATRAEQPSPAPRA